MVPLVLISMCDVIMQIRYHFYIGIESCSYLHFSILKRRPKQTGQNNSEQVKIELYQL